MSRKELLDALDDGFDHSIRDPLWNDIKLDGTFKSLYLEASVQKLDRIRQNGPACHIYPGAVHTRLAHSLGVYHTGRLIMKSLVRKDDVHFTACGIRSFLAACLLHDIGHFPYAHSLKELSIREHEELAGELISTDKSLREAVRGTGADAGMVMAIIDKNRPADGECMIYRNILSGALDPDKLDYLNRDAFFAGVPYGLQDNGYLISSMILHEGRIAIHRDALSSLENLLFSKYLMYRNVYWHKGVRSATCMIKKAILEALREKEISLDELYFTDDYEFDLLPRRHPGFEPFRLIGRVADNQLFVKVFEKAWDGEGRMEKDCGDLFSRLEVEDWLYRSLKVRYKELAPYEVVIDIQEPVSFESDTMVIDDKGCEPFTKASRIFGSDVARQFTLSLRTVSVFTPSYVDGRTVKEILDARYSF